MFPTISSGALKRKEKGVDSVMVLRRLVKTFIEVRTQ